MIAVQAAHNVAGVASRVVQRLAQVGPVEQQAAPPGSLVLTGVDTLATVTGSIRLSLGSSTGDSVTLYVAVELKASSAGRTGQPRLVAQLAREPVSGAPFVLRLSQAPPGRAQAVRGYLWLTHAGRILPVVR